MKRLWAPILVWLAVPLILTYSAEMGLDSYVIQIIGIVGLNIILTASLNLITGFTGQFSLGHAGFMAIGAYTSAILTRYAGVADKSPLEVQLIFAGSLILSGLAAALSGFVIGLPSLRLKGDYLAIVTLGFSEIIRVVILNVDYVGGARGFSGIPELANLTWIYFCAGLTLWVLARMIYSTRGQSFMAIRDDEIAAESIGIPSTRVKVTAFVVGAFFAGVGGALFAHFNTYLNPSSFGFVKSIEIVAMVVLGGMGSLTGSVFAAVVLTVLPEFLRAASDYRMVFYSLLLIVIMIARPQGLLGRREWFFRKKK